MAHNQDCDCDVCRARRSQAEQMIADANKASDFSKEDRAVIMTRFEGAPEEIQKAGELLVKKPKHENWAPISHHFISQVRSSEHKFSGWDNEETISVGFANDQKYQRGDMHMATLLLDGHEVSVCTVQELAGKKESWEKFIGMEGKIVEIFVDVPMSFVWGTLTYRQACRFMESISERYADEYSLEKSLARELEPLAKETVKRLADAIDDAEKQLTALNEQIRDQVRVVFEKTAQKQAVESGTDIKRALKELIEVIKSDAYEGFRIEGRHIFVTCKDVHIMHEGYNYSMGDYLVKLDVREGTMRISAVGKRQLSNRQKKIWRDRIHPHSGRDGACMGSYQQALAEAVLAHQFAEAMLLCRQFLSSYNPGSPMQNIHDFLPDHYYEIWNKDNNARPWENDDGLWRPGAEPSKADYKKCFKVSKEGVATVGKLRCLNKPFGKICEECSFFKKGRDYLYEACFGGSSAEICMKCGDFNCHKLKDGEDTCVALQKKAATESKMVLGCLSCSFNRMAVCNHGGNVAQVYEKCWEVQSGKTVADRACNGTCAIEACPHHKHEVQDYS